MQDEWLRPNKLAEVMDVYFANCDSNEKPRASAIGVTQSAFNKTRYKNTTPSNDPIKVKSKVANPSDSFDNQKGNWRVYNE